MTSFENVAKTLGEKFFVQKNRNGNLRIDLAALKQKGVRLNMVQKVGLFQEAQSKLVELGFEVNDDDIREGYFNRSNDWVSWPHIWVSPPKESVPTSSVVAEVIAQLSALGWTPPPPAEKVAEATADADTDAEEAVNEKAKEPAF